MTRFLHHLFQCLLYTILGEIHHTLHFIADLNGFGALLQINSSTIPFKMEKRQHLSKEKIIFY